MELKLTVCGSLCVTSEFEVNGVVAMSDDFGDKGDADSENAEDYGCGNMQFTRRDPTDEILSKYKISAEEYSAIADKLESGLSFGSCGWCI